MSLTYEKYITNVINSEDYFVSFYKLPLKTQGFVLLNLPKRIRYTDLYSDIYLKDKLLNSK